MPLLQKKYTFAFSVHWLWAFFGLAVVMIALFMFGHETWHPSLIFAAAVLAAGAALANAANALDSRASTAQQAKVAVAMAFINAWNHPTFFYCKKNGQAVLAHFKVETNVAKQVEFVEATPEMRANFHDVLNQFEALALAVNCDIADEETTKLFFRSLVEHYWHAAEGFMKHRRAERANARLYREFEKLHVRWKD